MHIAIDARIINSSTGRYVERLVTYLQDIDTVNQYSILVPEKDKDFWQPKSKNFTVRVINYPNYSFAEQFGFNRYLKKLDADLVHFCMPQQPIFYKGNHVTTVHDLNLLKTYNSDKNWLKYHLKQQVGRFVFKRIGQTSTHIITPSLFTKEEYQAFAGISDKKITVTYESADKSTSLPKPYIHPFKSYILYVGQQSDYKNIKRLGDAHQKLLKANPDLGLLLVGKKNQAALSNEAYFVKNNYKNILFTDFVSDAELAWLYTHCAAYVFPSLMEGFGLPGIEAMLYGAPVVSSNATCLPEIYGEAALYFDPENVDEMANAINQVVSNTTIKATLIKKGYEQTNKYSWRRMTEQTHQVYMEALKR